MDKNSINIEAINTIRLDNTGKKFTRVEMESVLHKMGFRKMSGLAKIFAEKGLILRRNNEYAFTNDPWYKGNLIPVLEEITKRQGEYTKAYRSRKKTANLTEEICISFLKEKGYKIQKLIPEHWEEF